MKEELEQKLVAKYPTIFKKYGSSRTESCMSYGCECNDGWYDILDTLCTALTSLYETGFFIDGESIILEAPKVVASQIKEKFGTLRFYYILEYPQIYHDLMNKYENTDKEHIIDGWANSYKDYIDGIIHMAEIMSSRTCEMSGKPGTYHTSGNGWCKVLNEEYAKTDDFCVSRGYKIYKSNEN